MMYRATKEFEFEMGHQLSKAKTKGCLLPHGHSYRMQVTVELGRKDENGMVMDFKELKEMVQPLVDSWDHGFLDEITFGENPTAEAMAAYAFKTIQEKLFKRNQTIADSGNLYASSRRLYCVRLWETRGSFVEVYG